MLTYKREIAAHNIIFKRNFAICESCLSNVEIHRASSIPNCDKLIIANKDKDISTFLIVKNVCILCM